ncbi:MAG: AMP-binding protein [Verrucomicrobia bacterium]|nr:AMP-binding protein [Verrucomicrobiota bacterium]
MNSRAELESRQLTQLRELLGAVTASNRFYQAKLGGIEGLDGMASLSEYARVVPLTTKAELVRDQRAHPPYGSNLTFPVEEYTRFHQTSGTTGQPLRWLDTPRSWDALVEGWVEVFEAAGVHAGDRVLFAFTFGPFIGFWMAFEAATRLGCLCLPGGGLTSAARLRMILDNEVTVLCCTPTYAARLAEVAAEESLSLAGTGVRLLVVAGEPGGSIPGVRSRLERLWCGARVFDHHGMTEVGPVTYECPAQPGVLHVIESGYLPEVIDPRTGQAPAPGESGELVLTTLRRLGSPLLRYRTGDLVRARPPGRAPCVCGRVELALEGGILGRVDDMLIIRGVNVFPGAVDEIIRGLPEIAEYQVRIETVHHLDELKVLIEPLPGCAEVSDLVGRLRKALQDAFALRVPVSPVDHGTLPRFEMKARRWVRANLELPTPHDQKPE